tara:strand:- start:1601 stop:2011 length:411 start_codon:yes stop_codon:yes gene_type:complete
MTEENKTNEHTEEELMAILEDGIKQVSEVVNTKYQQVLAGDDVDSPVLGDVFVNMKEAGVVAVAATDIFSVPLVDIQRSIGNTADSRYSFMTEDQKTSVKNLMESVVNECANVYTSEVPDIEKLEKNIERLSQSEK